MKKIILFILLPFFSTGQTQIGLNIDGEDSLYHCGKDIALSNDGNILAVSYPGGRLLDNFNTNGHVKVFNKINNSWVQIGNTIQGTVNAPVGPIVSLSANGSILAIGSYTSTSLSGTSGGIVSIYQNISGNWIQIGNDIIDDPYFRASGYSISLSDDGNTIAIGTPRNDFQTGLPIDIGKVRVFHYNGTSWVQVGENIYGTSAYDIFGSSVSLSSNGMVLAIGAYRNDGNGADSGQVKIFENNAGSWIQLGNDIFGESAGDWCGKSISLSADGYTIAIGSPHHIGVGLSGHVRVFNYNSGTWNQVGSSITAITINPNTQSNNGNSNTGDYVALSADGGIVAIASLQNRTWVDSSGYAGLYKNSSGVWTQVGTNIVEPQNSNSSNGSFITVAISGDGKTFAIGDPNHDSTSSRIDSGHVRVFDMTTELLLNSDSFTIDHFSLLPNPSSDYVTIVLDSNFELVKINLYNTNGQLIKSEASTTIINLKDFSKGTYFCEVITNKGKSTKTILVK